MITINIVMCCFCFRLQITVQKLVYICIHVYVYAHVYYTHNLFSIFFPKLSYNFLERIDCVVMFKNKVVEWY